MTVSMTLLSNRDPNLTAIQAYLAGDLEGVQAAYAPFFDLFNDLFAGVPMPSSECSPCYEADTHTDIGTTMIVAYNLKAS